MKPLPVASFRDLMNGQQTATITCLYSQKVVRKLTVQGDRVQIDPNTEDAPAQYPIISVPLDTPITYQPWVMDRGNLNFETPEIPEGAKICGEGDIITFPNEKRSIVREDATEPNFGIL